MIELSIQTDSKDFQINKEKVLHLTKKLLETLHLKEQELSLVFVDEKGIQALNRDYREKDKPTDVLSFPQQNWETPLTFSNKEELTKELLPGELLGDVVISLSYAQKSAQSIGHSLSREVAFLIIHGLLHLCGHDHMEPEEEALMIAEQKNLLSTLEDFDEPLWQSCVLNTKDSQ